MNTTIYPDRSESDALKGLFILIVVYAHNALLVPTASVFQHYIYQFHYFSFFILPFFYPPKRVTFSRFSDHFIKIYIPYFWFYLFTYFLYNILLTSNGFNILQFITTFCSGEISQLKMATGFHFLWFLPAFFMFTILRELFSTSGWVSKNILILIGLFFHFSEFYGLPSYSVFRSDIPFAITQAFYFFPIGALSWLIMRSLFSLFIFENQKKIVVIMLLFTSLILFISLSFSFFDDGRLAASNAMGEVRNFFLPISFFIICYSVRSYLQKASWLREIGKYSLEIYLFHIFIYNIMYKLFLYISPQQSLWKGILLFVSTLIVTFILVKILDRCDLTRKIIFPSELKSLKNVLKKEDT